MTPAPVAVVRNIRNAAVGKKDNANDCDALTNKSTPMNNKDITTVFFDITDFLELIGMARRGRC
jgi:hypothetical protein